MKNKLLVFSYDFSHKKSYLFLKEIFKRTDIDIVVYAGPWISLKGQEVPSDQEFHPKKITEQYGHKYIKGSHKDVDHLKKIIEENNIKTAIIAGARIIPEDVISLFEIGIINFHPGMIPETSGLDSFFWMIQKDSLPGITVHYIDKKVDAGELIFFHHKEDLNKDENLSEVRSSMLNTQVQALKRLLSFFMTEKKMFSEKILNHSKNQPMDDKQKEIVSDKFYIWRDNTLNKQAVIKQAFKDISSDDLKSLMALDKSFLKSLVHYKNNNGRTLLAESVFHHSQKCVEYLLSVGFDINEKNDKGTTIMMYAKTKLLNKKLSNENLRFLEMLLSQKPKLNEKDLHEKRIYDYIPYEENIELISILKK